MKNGTKGFSSLQAITNTKEALFSHTPLLYGLTRVGTTDIIACKQQTTEQRGFSSM